MTVRVLISGERCAVAVAFDHDPPGEHEYVLFALHYYAQCLSALVGISQSARRLTVLVDRVLAHRGHGASDVFEAAAVKARFCHPVDIERQETEIACVVTQGARGDVHLSVDLSELHQRDIKRSALAVVQLVVARISPETSDLLFSALANMNAAYGVTHRFSEPRAVDELPSNALRAAAFI